MRGGFRENSGRRKGTSEEFRKEMIAFMSTPEMKGIYFAKIKERIIEGDTRMLSWIGDQIIGRAPQTLELAGNQENPILLKITRLDDDGESNSTGV